MCPACHQHLPCGLSSFGASCNGISQPELGKPNQPTLVLWQSPDETANQCQRSKFPGGQGPVVMGLWALTSPPHRLELQP